MMLNNEEKIELLSKRIIFLREVLASENQDLAELKRIDHAKVGLVESDILDRVTSIAALEQELESLKEPL
jgi:hypothetical protein